MSAEGLPQPVEPQLTPQEYGQRVLALQDFTWTLLGANPQYLNALHRRFQTAGESSAVSPGLSRLEFTSADKQSKILVSHGVILHPQGEIANRTLTVEAIERGTRGGYTDCYKFSMKVQTRQDKNKDDALAESNNVMNGLAISNYYDLQDWAWGTDLYPTTVEKYKKFKALLTELLTDPASQQIITVPAGGQRQETPAR